ncbi:MAG: type II toxin-antitoxin system RelE/ParE family toxin [Candidatus Poribacteria bacterium]
MNFKITILPSAKRDLKKLKQRGLEIVQTIQRALSENPYPHDDRVKPIRGFPYPLYELKVANYRVVEANEVTVYLVIHRRDLERGLRTRMR